MYFSLPEVLVSQFDSCKNWRNGTFGGLEMRGLFLDDGTPCTSCVCWNTSYGSPWSWSTGSFSDWEVTFDMTRWPWTAQQAGHGWLSPSGRLKGIVGNTKDSTHRDDVMGSISRCHHLFIHLNAHPFFCCCHKLSLVVFGFSKSYCFPSKSLLV